MEGEILANSFKLIDFVNSNELKQYKKKDKITYLSVILFLDQFFNVTLDKVECSEEMVMISETKKYSYMMKNFDMNSDYKNLVQIAVIRTLSNTKIADQDIITYSLECLRVLF